MESAFFEARSVLGPMLITPEDITQKISIGYTQSHLAHLARTLPSRKILEECLKSGHWLIATPETELSLLRIAELVPSDFEALVPEELWYKRPRHLFARHDAVGLRKSGWLAVSDTPVPFSDGKNFATQMRLMAPYHRLPNVAEAAWFAVLALKIRETPVFEGYFVRTSSFSANAEPYTKDVIIGRYQQGGHLIVDVSVRRPQSPVMRTRLVTVREL